MGIEDFNGGITENESNENYGEVLVQEQIMTIIKQINTKLAEDPQHNVNGHWEAAITRLSIATGKDDVNNVLAKNGWNIDNFPQDPQ